MKTSIHEPARETPLAHECDLCIIGGSCTGVFAAVRAARLGLTVALVEQNVLLGGMATAAQVNEWHSLYNMAGTHQIIGGLTAEILDGLRKRDAVLDLERKHRGPYSLFNSAELTLDLDELIRSHPGIRLFLKASCVAAVRDGNRLDAAIIEDKSGRRAIGARFFIDASGDGDLLRRAGFAAWRNDHLQPVNYQMMVAGLERIIETAGKNFWPQLQDLADKYGYPRENATPWINRFSAQADLRNIYGPRLNHVDASDADALTAALLESRRCHRALHDMIRERFGPAITPLSPAHALGVRETWHADSLYRLSAGELLEGHGFEDAIACGTYPVDVHSPDGTLLRYLDGREDFVHKEGPTTHRRWREASDQTPPCYHIPYRSLVPRDADNLLVAGRLIDADREAFGGIRVMVNMNQTGEAAGVAACLALREGCTPAAVDPSRLRATLCDGGSLLPETQTAGSSTS
ncbi:MAG: FAD-dependent oxidoreductase [Verrucomicrobiota bacterium JB024]|nr:FAD-dependent oxidoreductase [Verrucomicrobiota bacterium JB024]